MVPMDTALEKTGAALFSLLAERFPVSCASDEFYFFPQATLTPRCWQTWDDYEPQTIADTVGRLRAFERAFEKMLHCNKPHDPAYPHERMDIALLSKMAQTLAEQLDEVRAWRCQPTLYLSLACIGLAEAFQSQDPRAVPQRCQGLGAFLDQATCNLERVPHLFRDLGLQMAADTRAYLVSIGSRVPGLKRALAALERFTAHLREVPGRRDFRLAPDLFKRVVRNHLGCGMDLEDIREVLELEILAARRKMAKVLDDAFGGCSQEEALARIPLPQVGDSGLLALYRGEVERLAHHCRQQGWVSDEMLRRCPVQVAAVPSYLAATRAASSYSIPPRHPPDGGVFYIFNARQPQEARQPYQREYRILCAHETYPGHHLLDINRWRLQRPARRLIERPLFYEGWACFAEELMAQSGYLASAADRLLMARRRLWRALRGRIDLGLQTGKMSPENAAALLATGSVPIQRALAAVRKYPLNPGYQLCYTVGLRNFERLFKRFGGPDTAGFVGTVMSAGEIGFRDLETILKSLP